MNPFKLWSQTQPDALSSLKPNFGMRSWDDITYEDKHIIWKNLEFFFFDKDAKTKNKGYRNSKKYYEFFGKYNSEKSKKEKRIVLSIIHLNNKYKANNFAPNFLEESSVNSACFDFSNIFMKESEYVVLELLSLYCKMIILEKNDKELGKNEGENNTDYKIRTEEWRYKEFNSFTKELNNVFEDFGINVILTRQGFVPKQEEKITKKIFIPVLKVLSDKKWKKVNEHLSDAFKTYQQKEYSHSITNTISGIQAFLQILVKGKIGSGDISKLIPKAMEKSLIPNDTFSKQIFKNIESIFAKERQIKGMAHPRIANPSEDNARLILNLTMVFIQHCLQIEYPKTQ